MASPVHESDFNIQNDRTFCLQLFKANQWGVEIQLPFFYPLTQIVQ